MLTDDTHEDKIKQNTTAVEKQHIEILSTLDTINEGFRNVDK